MIVNADLFTGVREAPRIRSAAIAVQTDRIVDVGPEAELAATYDAKRKVDARGGITHPGFIETHLHMPSPVFHGLSIDPYGRDQRCVSYSRLKCQSDARSTEALSAASAISMMRRGFTCFCEPGTVFETEAFVAGLTKVGLRGLVSVPFGWDDVSAFREHEPGYVTDQVLNRAPADTRRVVEGLNKILALYSDPDALVRGFVCLYGLGSSSNELMQDAVAIARHAGVVFNQHQAFMQVWNETETRSYGMSGIERLDRNGALGPMTSLTHMNYLNDEDVSRVVSSGTNVIWCPNMSLPRRFHDGNRCWHPELYRRGVNVAIATDTALEYPLGSAGMTALLLSSVVHDKIKQSDPFYMQTADAAKVVGLGSEIGSVSPGKKADIVIRRAVDINHSALDDLGSILGTSSTQLSVDSVVINGSVVMRNGSSTLIDQDLILAEAMKHRRHLIEGATQ